MRVFRILTVIVAAVSVTCAAALWGISIKNNDMPVITCSVDGTIEAKSDITDEELLQFVTAVDKRDGDLTDKIVVERKKYFVSKGMTVISYAVCDSDNNVVKLQKNLKFTDYEFPKLKLKSDFIIHTGDNPEMTGLVSAYDVCDGDISSRIKIITTSFNYTVAGEYDINCKVTNSYGDTTDITFKAIVTDDDYSGSKIQLSDYIIYVPKNTEIDFRQYITGIQNHRIDDITVDSSEYNPQESGVYNIYYNYSNVSKTRLVVVVEEG
jgi:hypothetical protein